MYIYVISMCHTMLAIVYNRIKQDQNIAVALVFGTGFRQK